jgi:pyruvate carboxylase
MYRTVNDMFGDIVKVTPSSKAVGDMAIFMIQNELTPENIYDKAKEMAFPDSVVSYFQGMMGQPQGGFPEKLQKLVLRDIEPVTCRPGELLPDEDLEGIRSTLTEKYKRNFSDAEVISYALYPKVFDDYLEWVSKNGDFSRMGSDVFFHGLAEGETCEVDVAIGKTMVIKMVEVGKLDDTGHRTLIFEINGNRREIQIKDKTSKMLSSEVYSTMADPANPLEIGSSIPGTVTKLLVKEGDSVVHGQTIAIVEAMKMETAVMSSENGKVAKIYVKETQMVKSGELLIELVV